ncbi:Methyltransferase-like protein 7B [Physocladia obscura]|uniref:Methyltransferase-like protein 7B n=1 Tax=Physocladia obscura TaxID=109957 RepID=A0AAD5T3Z5_9FUNG|nr:Methyltransferase-like protein 7B [Physocladia obscura]
MLQRAFDAFKLLKADPATSLPPTTFSILDISSADPLPQNLLNSFDSVLDTFGLCSVRDPTQSVINMRNLCKPGGKIVLLEHGRSAFPLQFIADMLNSALDKTAQNHAEKWGCCVAVSTRFSETRRLDSGVDDRVQ